MTSYITVAPNETVPRRQNQVIRGMMDGKTNNVGSFTIATTSATTVVIDFRVGADSVILLSPTTANAATEAGAGVLYVSSVGKKTFTVSHVNSSTSARTFNYAVIG